MYVQMLQLTVLVALADATAASDPKLDLIIKQNEPMNGKIMLFGSKQSCQARIEVQHYVSKKEFLYSRTKVWVDTKGKLSTLGGSAGPGWKAR